MGNFFQIPDAQEHTHYGDSWVRGRAGANRYPARRASCADSITVPKLRVSSINRPGSAQAGDSIIPAVAGIQLSLSIDNEQGDHPCAGGDPVALNAVHLVSCSLGAPYRVVPTIAGAGTCLVYPNGVVGAGVVLFEYPLRVSLGITAGEYGWLFQPPRDRGGKESAQLRQVPVPPTIPLLSARMPLLARGGRTQE